MPNRLANETSPYLLQHKDNPVDWYPWGEEAFERARKENKPIFLSVGYSSCHWCHVMAHESFEDEETAALMNEKFINIKVDREERPDVDSIYMSVVQALTGRGGWPMSVWMLPDGRPFFGGTYYPKQPMRGMPTFMRVLMQLATVFEEQRDALEEDASKITASVRNHLNLETQGQAVNADVIFQTAFQALSDQFDQRNGGFSTQPKFPPSMTLELLLRLANRYDWPEATRMVEITLDKMLAGGMYDQLGGGFARYSVDAVWLVPHFEKMLYDNALLLRSYLYGYQVFGKEAYRGMIDETIAYLKREMVSPEGGFYSSQDADSEGEEGKFFIWKKKEISEALSNVNVNIDALLEYWGVDLGPNFEGHNILWRAQPLEEVAEKYGMSIEELQHQIRTAKQVLFAIRETRIRPGRDDKILAAWNGLMIHSLARIGRSLGNDEALDLAVQAGEFIANKLMQNGRLLRSYKDGRARFNAYLEDYAFVAEAFLELYQATFDLKWFEYAFTLTETMLEQFWTDHAGFFDTSHDHEDLISRPQSLQDNAIPSGTSSAVAVLLRMAILANRPDWEATAQKLLDRLAPVVANYPLAFGYLGSQFEFATNEVHEIALVGDSASSEMGALLDVINTPFRPNQVVAKVEGEGAAERIPLLQDRDQLNGKPTAYVCQHYVCQLPVTTPDALEGQLA